MLTEKQLNDIKELQSVCEKNDANQLKLNWDFLNSPAWDSANCLFYYENNTLVGFLGAYPFGSKVELCGMVHPDFRRRGIFSKLFQAASDQFSGKYKIILLNAPSNSTLAKQFLKNVSCEYDTTEYQMQWQPTELEDFERVILRLSETEDDFQNEVMLDVQGFGFPYEEAIEKNSRLKADETQVYYMIEFENITVGKIRVAHLEDEAWIYGFVVFPEWQGRGIGRRALEQLTKKEHELAYKVFLEVDAANSNALRLYQSCGYKTIQAQDYYILKNKN